MTRGFKNHKTVKDISKSLLRIGNKLQTFIILKLILHSFMTAMFEYHVITMTHLLEKDHFPLMS